MNNEFDYFPQSNQSNFEYTPMLPQTSGHAKGYSQAALWLGIASLFCTCCCCCFYMLAPILSALAIVMAILARRDNQRRMTGAATAGLILSIIGLILFAFILLFEIIMVTMPESEFREMIREIIEENYGMSLEEYLDAMRSDVE